VLLTARRVLSLDPTPTGHRAHLRCWCGTVVAMDVDRLGRIDAEGAVSSLTAA
jgi:hypothetical protein